MKGMKRKIVGFAHCNAGEISVWGHGDESLENKGR